MNALIVAFAFKLNYHVLRLAEASGCTVHVLGRDCGLGLKFSRFCSSYQHFDFDPTTQSLEKAVMEIERAIARVSADVILPSDAVSTRLLAAVADRLSIPTYPLPSAALFDTMNNKWDFYRFCKEHGVQTPETLLFNDVKSLKQALAQGAMHLPVIVKLLDSMANKGIYPILSESDLPVLDTLDSQPLLMQKFVVGELFCVNAVVNHGRLVAYSAQRNFADHYAFVSYEKLLATVSRVL
jgi:glutathione synthase/RimK-type ligase-like ATP-grasp enzyme